MKGYKSLDSFKGTALSHLTTPDKAELVEGTSYIDPDLCIGCGKCVRIGHCTAITLKDNKAEVDSKKCIGCGVCWSVCPAGAVSYKLVP